MANFLKHCRLTPCIKQRTFRAHKLKWGGDRGGGEAREAGEEGVGSGILKLVGRGRNREKYANIAQYLKKCKEVGGNKNKAGTVKREA